MKVLETLKDQFQAAANNYPRMAHLVVCSKLTGSNYPSKKRITQKEQAKRKAIAFQAAIDAHMEVELGYEITSDRQVDCWTSDSAMGREYYELHCLLRPQNLTWDKETARETVKSLADEAICQIIDSPALRGTLPPQILLSDNHTGGWLAVIHDLQGIIKKVCKQGNRRMAEDGEPYYSVVDDVFLKSALSCDILLEQAKEADLEGKGVRAGKQPTSKRKPVKKAVERVLDEHPDLEGNPKELTKAVNKKLKSWDYEETTKDSVKTIHARIRKGRKQEKD